VQNTQGRLVDIPPKAGYGFLEQIQQREAAKHGLTPAQYQASAWIGAGQQTGVKSKLTPWLAHFEERLERTARKHRISKDEVLRRFTRGEMPLVSLGAAAAMGIMGPDPADGPDD
jgi:hypothetical protein